jgi:phosphoglycerol transferase MdoB-like AlkP superfamily enzyme
MFSNLPKLIKFLIILVSLEILLFTVFRFIFLIGFYHYGENFSYTDILYSFWVGFRFDLQLAILVNLPILLTGGIKFIGIFKSLIAKYFWILYILVTNIALISLYIIDIAYFDFYKKMVDSSIIRYFYDIQEAFKMLSEGYPIVSTVLISILFFILLFIFIKTIYNKIDLCEDPIIGKTKKIVLYTFFVILYIFAGYGKLEFYPWRWSEAFYSSNNFISYLSSNPITYFTNTLKNQDIKYDLNETKRFYPYIANFLEVKEQNTETLNLIRVVKPNHSTEYTFNKPNIIFILGESTSFGRSSISNNPLNPTPYINQMAKEGISYSRYYTPHAGTARSVWTAMTGLVDVERMKTSSRNPMTIEQNMILNSIKDYKKFYFIGGSLSWGNVRGVIGNVNNINTREESSYQSPRNDVWGISDVHLVKEVHETIKKEKKPFFAFIQLSGNHSPNTIPDETFGFKIPEDIEKDQLLKYSFDGKQNEFLGQRFLDYSVGKLIKLAKQEQYFDNTIFIFAGDHGLPRRADHLHQAEKAFDLATIHTPFIIYAPKLLKHKKIDYPVSEVDIMATIGGLTGQTYVNSTFGRDILEKDFHNKQHYSFYMTHENNPTISLIGKEFIFRVRADGTNKRLFKYYFEKENDNLLLKYPAIAKEMEKICRGIYENTRYTRFYNSSTKIKEFLKTKKE